MLRKLGFAGLLYVATATASAREWSVIDGLVAGRADPNRVSVLVIAVDGKADFDAPSIKTIAPGFHYVQLASTRQDRRGEVAYVPYAFVAEACRRYEVYAEYESELDSSRWYLNVRKDPKPLGGCKPKQAAPPVTQAAATTPAQREPSPLIEPGSDTTGASQAPSTPAQ